MVVQRNKAIVGRNAFAHEAGIHQDGMLKERTTYEIMRPEDVGFSQTDSRVGQTQRSGGARRSGAYSRLPHRRQATRSSLFAEFKKLADKKKEIYDGDIAALIEQSNMQDVEQWQFASYEVHANSGASPSATITLISGGSEHSTTIECGDGPLDALFRAIEEITDKTVVVKDFRVQSATRGKDAQGESIVEVEYGGRVYRGRGVSTDTVEAGARAFLNAINRIEIGQASPEKHDAV